jgi:hypothetical protein
VNAPRWWRQLRDPQAWLEHPRWVPKLTERLDAALLRRSVRRLHKRDPGFIDVREFYDADPRRRASPERHLGDDWFDAKGGRFTLFWIEMTGELCVMRVPTARFNGSAAGDPGVAPGLSSGVSMSAPMRVLGLVDSSQSLDRLLAGPDALGGRLGGVEWLESRVSTTGEGCK